MDIEQNDSDSMNRRQRPRKRATKKPNRLGQTTDFWESDHDLTDPYEDDSLEEYIPSPKKKKIDFQKRKQQVATVHEHVPSTDIYSKRMELIDFNEQFDTLKSSSENVTKSTDESRCTPHVDSTGKNQLKEEHVLNSIDAFKLIEKVNSKLDELLSRFSVFESTFIGNMATNGQKCKPDLDDGRNELDCFSKSNELPAKNIETLQRFEQNLEDAAFRKVVVCIHMN